MSEQHISKLTCPHCGNSTDMEEVLDDPWSYEGFRYIEDIVCYRPVKGIEDGRLIVEGLYESGEGYDDGTNPRFECRRCLGEFPVPEWVLHLIDWD